MDHEVVPSTCKISDWLYDHFGLHQGKNVIDIMEFEVFKKNV